MTRLPQIPILTTFPGWWFSTRHSLRRRSSRLAGGQQWRDAIADLATWETLSSTRLAVAIALLVLLLAAAVPAIAGDPPAWPNQDILVGLWQVEATLIGLALALIVFALQAGGATAALRRDLTVSSSFYAAMNLGLVLLLVTGVAAVGIGSPYGRWLAGLAIAGSAVWSTLFAAAVREAILTTDPVYRVRTREHVVMRATVASLRRELVRNVGRTLLETEVRAADGVLYPWVLARAELAESSRVRVGRRGEVRDANIVEIRAVFDQWARNGINGQIGISLWDQVLPETLVVQANAAVSDSSRTRIVQALRIGEAEAVRSVSDQIGLLRLEAQETLGPDTSSLSAVLAAYDRVLEAYALGWRAHVDLLEAQHIGGFASESGAPVRAIRDSLFELLTAAAEKEAADAEFALAYWPIHVMRLSVSWRAPAYFEFVDAYPFLYEQIRISKPVFQRRLLDRSWIHLVEFLELLAPTLRPPYVVDFDEDLLNRAEKRARQALWAVLRNCVRASDQATAREGLRRWRIAEDRGTRETPMRIATGLPMLWEVVRRVRAGSLEGADQWLRIAAASTAFETVLAALAEQLDPANS